MLNKLSRACSATMLAACTFTTLTPLPAHAAAARPASFDELVGDLRGADEPKRSLARQLIPRQGAEAVRPVLPLLFDANDTVSWAAMNVLLDICNLVSVPGREDERGQVSEALLASLKATTNEPHQFLLLRILPIVVPEGADLSPIAALLHSETAKEKARVALQEMNTTEARAALRGALPQADANFAVALMDALDKTHDTESFPLLRKKLESGTPSEQAAAARGLAASGDPALAEPLLALSKSIDINDRFTAEDAVLRLADNLVKQGGSWDAGIALYTSVLEQSENPVIQVGALNGLGRFGDETALDTIMTAWASEPTGLLEGPAMAAIEALQGPAIADKLIAAYDAQPAPVQERLLGIMGRKQDPRYLPIIEKATGLSASARIAALQQTQLPEAVPTLEALAKSGTEEEAAQVSDAIARLAKAFRDQGNPAGAGRAYLAQHRIAKTDEARNAALEGIKSFPVPEAYDELKATLGEDGLLALPDNVLSGMAQSLAGAGRGEESKVIRTALLARATDTATVERLIALGPVEGTPEDLAKQLGFINHWTIVGHFPLKDAPADGSPVLVNGAVDLAARYGDAAWTDKAVGGAFPHVDLMGFAKDQARAFAYATIKVAADQDAVLRLGSDDGIRAWVNGAKVHENVTDRGVALDSDQVPVKLKAGENAILLEIIQHAGGWGFIARLTAPDGAPLAFEIVTK
ncbi:MAG: hypothetical protein IT368_02170 [Candidatus Hydrogenedentes bacterium]|nr:hypothetical protein [Candidatus Hydrogenedentota bacterium]